MADLSDKILQLDRGQEEVQAQAKAKALGLPYLNLQRQPLDERTLKLIPRASVESLQVLALDLHGQDLTIGVVEPDSQGVREGLANIEKMTGYNVKPAVISTSSFAYGHKTYELLVRENEGERPVVISDSDKEHLAQLAEELKSGKELPDLNVTDMLSAILAEGVNQQASDVHLEPMEKDLEIRFRIDGVLHQAMRRPLSDYHGLVSRVKYLAKMPLGASGHPQDGRFTITVADTPLDLRIASLPTVYGDMLTVRILYKDRIDRTLGDLGLRNDTADILKKAISLPHGMVLVTGPTGSGKTTTLYALLKEINIEEQKVITIEDPVEYRVAGLEQSQVDAEHGYDFAEALRGALRQDPDVLMIGEVRDQETANIAIRAALTGHIVLATLHANDAPAALSRLLEMNVEPFLFSGSINAIIAQRLLRFLCPDCKKARALSPEEIKLFTDNLGRVPVTIFEAVGCDKCHKIGYRGRTGVFEAIVPSHAMEQLALTHAPLTDFETQAHKDGLITMMQDGLLKVEQGLTSLAEVMRVTKE